MPTVTLIVLAALVVFSPSIAAAQCRGYSGPGGACYSGPGGGLSSGPGGGLYAGPGGGMYSGPGGGIYTGPPGGEGAYKGPWSPCITGVKGPEWRRENCPK